MRSYTYSYIKLSLVCIAARPIAGKRPVMDSMVALLKGLLILAVVMLVMVVTRVNPRLRVQVWSR